MLDTSVVIAADVGPLEGDLAISCVTLAELHFGVLVATTRQVRAERLRRLLLLQRTFQALPLDEGTEWFQPSNLEITDIAVGEKGLGNPATNVIPAKASARISIRFNDRHTGESLTRKIEAMAAPYGGSVRAVVSGEAFLTLPGAFSALVVEAVKAETGITPEISTSGGTSDARFLRALSPVIECGLSNATMHKRDEAVAVADLAALARIYRRIALAGLASG